MSGYSDGTKRTVLGFDTTSNYGMLAAVNNGTATTLTLNPAGGNVGIGTTAPTSIFQVNDGTAKTANYTGVQFNLTNTSSSMSVNKVGVDIQSTGNWNASGAVNTALNVNATGGLTNYAAVFSGGNVGIGTTAPTATLQVTSGTKSFAASLAANATDSLIQLTSAATTNWARIGTNGSSLALLTQGTDSSSTTPAMIVTNTGSVGIGSATPAGLLDVSGKLTVLTGGSVGIGTTTPTATLSMGGTAARTIQVDRNTTANSAGSSLTVQAGAATSAVTDKNGGTLYIASGTATGTGTSTIEFQTATAGGSATTDRTPTTKMLIDGAGNVGISTTAPVGLLDVNRKLTVLSAGNVGIGTTAPTGALSIGGSSQFQVDTSGNLVKINNIAYSWPGAQGAASQVLTNNGSGGLSWTTPNNGWSTDGSSKATTSYNVGIGSATPAQALDVYGNVKVNGASSATIYIGTAGQGAPGAGSAGERIQLSGTAGTNAATDYGIGYETNFLWFNTNGGTKWYKGGTQQMLLDSSGNLGIGTGAPVAALHVNVGTEAIFGTGNNSTTPAPFTIRGPDGTGASNVTGPNLTIRPGNGMGANNSGSLIFQTAKASGTASVANTMTQRMMINADGYVGIGTTTSITAPLQVTAISANTAPDTNGIYVNNPDNTSTSQHAIIGAKVGGASAGDPYISLAVNGGSSYALGIDNTDGDKFKISRTVNDVGNNTALTIEPTNGNVGIGSTSPTTTLDVNGTVSAKGFKNSSGSYTINNGSTSLALTDASGVVLLTNAASGNSTISTVTGCNSGTIGQGQTVTFVAVGWTTAGTLGFGDTNVGTATADTLVLNGSGTFNLIANNSSHLGSSITLLCTTIGSTKRWIEVSRSANTN